MAEAEAEADGEAQESEDRATMTEPHPSVHVVDSAAEARRVAALLSDLAAQDSELVFGADTEVRRCSFVSTRPRGCRMSVRRADWGCTTEQKMLTSLHDSELFCWPRNACALIPISPVQPWPPFPPPLQRHSQAQSVFRGGNGWRSCIVCRQSRCWYQQCRAGVRCMQ